MNDLATNGNLIEAILWFGFTIVFACKVCAARKRLRRLFSILVIAFFIFGLSDLIEARTGAWWRPWWLLVMKCGCIATFAYGVLEYRQIKKPTTNT